MSNIPGLLHCPVDDVNGEGIEMPSFTGTSVIIPESHRYGNCRTVSDFERLGIIADGAFGVLYKCKDKKTKEICVLKKFKMPSDLQDGIPSSILREINLLNTMKHNNLIHSHGTVAGRNLDSNFLILDYCAFSLKELFERNIDALYGKDIVKCIMKQLFKGLEYIHGGLIIHRDISSKNLLFDERGILKISGFRASRFYSKRIMTPGITDVEFRSPELLFQADLYGPAVDMWSAGCVFAHLLLRKALFYGNCELEVLKSIFGVLGTPSETIWPGFDKLFSQMDGGSMILEQQQIFSNLKQIFAFETGATRDLILELLIYYPSARLSAQECLKCSYFTEPPRESSANLAAILQDIESSVELSNEVDMSI